MTHLDVLSVDEDIVLNEVRGFVPCPLQFTQVEVKVGVVL